MLVTGDPVPGVERARGPFVELMRQTLAGAWSGPLAVLDARRGELPVVAETSALLITGSPESVVSRAPWILAAEARSAELVHAGVPTLGVCFGHQLLGQALGGLVEVNPRGREIGTVELERFTDDPLFEGAPPAFAANMSHCDSVTALPPGARVLARTRLEPNAAVRFGEHAWGVQFHPEFDGDVMRGYIAARLDRLAAEGIDASGLAATDAPEAARVLRTFARLAGS